MTETTTIRWEGRLGLRESEASAQRLSDALAAGGTVVVDAAGLEAVDVSHVQILLAAHRSAAAAGRRLEAKAPPGGALREALERSGVAAAKGHRLVWDGDAWTGVAAQTEREAA